MEEFTAQEKVPTPGRRGCVTGRSEHLRAQVTGALMETSTDVSQTPPLALLRFPPEPGKAAWVHRRR